MTQIIVTPQAQREVEEAATTINLPADVWSRVAHSLRVLETFPLAGAELGGADGPRLGSFSDLGLGCSCYIAMRNRRIESSSSRCTTRERRVQLHRAEPETHNPSVERPVLRLHQSGQRVQIGLRETRCSVSRWISCRWVPFRRMVKTAEGDTPITKFPPDSLMPTKERALPDGEKHGFPTLHLGSRESRRRCAPVPLRFITMI